MTNIKDQLWLTKLKQSVTLVISGLQKINPLDKIKCDGGEVSPPYPSPSFLERFIVLKNPLN